MTTLRELWYGAWTAMVTWAFLGAVAAAQLSFFTPDASDPWMDEVAL